MNGITLLLVSVAILVIGYIFYGRYLCKKWGGGERDIETCVFMKNMKRQDIIPILYFGPMMPKAF